jgi:cytochrome c
VKHLTIGLRSRGALSAGAAAVALLGAAAWLVPRIAAAQSAHAVIASSAPQASSVPCGDAAHGKALYQACAACHSIDENDIGPRHRGVVGRPAGSIEDYAYSAALKQSGLKWDEGTLDRWLINPSALVPGTKMFFKIDDAQSRADIIAYLKQQQ